MTWFLLCKKMHRFNLIKNFKIKRVIQLTVIAIHHVYKVMNLSPLDLYLPLEIIKRVSTRLHLISFLSLLIISSIPASFLAQTLRNSRLLTWDLFFFKPSISAGNAVITIAWGLDFYYAALDSVHGKNKVIEIVKYLVEVIIVKQLHAFIVILHFLHCV